MKPSMPDATDSKLLDKRVAQRYLKKGRLDDKEYQRHLEALPDLADAAEEVEAEFQPTSVPARQHGTPANEPDGLED
jgi:hypothetical protein